MYPDGTDVEVFTMSALEKTNREAHDDSDREHVTFYMWKKDNGFKTEILHAESNFSHYRYTVDYPEDFEVITFLAKKIDENNIDGSVSEVVEIFDNNPEIFNLNSKYHAGLGWRK